MLTQLHIIAAIKKLYPAQDIFNINRTNMFDKAMGTDKVRLELENGSDAHEIYNSFENELKIYKETRDKYLIYF